MDEKLKNNPIDGALEERIRQLKEAQEQENYSEEKIEISPDTDEEDLNEIMRERLGHSSPFELSINLGGEVLEDLAFDQDEITIGRDAKCDVNIDNLGASRIHAKIERCGRFFLLRDMGSKTGTFVRGARIEEFSLNHGDEIFLAKHTLKFNKIASTRWHGESGAGKQKDGKGQRQQLMQTMAVDFRNMAKKQGPAAATLQFIDNNRSIPINKNVLFFGKSAQCDFIVNGFLVGEKHVLLASEKRGFTLYHLGFWKAPRVNEKAMETAILKEGDLVEIGDVRFIYHAPKEA